MYKEFERMYQEISLEKGIYGTYDGAKVRKDI